MTVDSFIKKGERAGGGCKHEIRQKKLEFRKERPRKKEAKAGY